MAEVVESQDEADTPLHLACAYQQLPTIELLLKAAQGAC